MIRLILILVTTLCLPTFADERKGFWITPDQPTANKRALKSGDSTNLTGKICLAKVLQEEGVKCINFSDNHIEVKAYFPDEVTEVTQDLTLTKNNGIFEYKYVTGPLAADAPNSLTLVVGSVDHRAKTLLKIKAKLEKRIAHFKKRLEKYDSNPKHTKRAQVIESYISLYQKYLDYISGWIKENSSILAQMSQPLQVDNNLSSQLLHSSIFDNVKLSLNIPMGAPIKGESATVKTEVTFLEARSAHFTNDGFFAVNYYVDGNLVSTTPEIEGEIGQSVLFEFELPNLKPENENLLEVELVHALNSKDGRPKWASFWDWFSKWTGKRGISWLHSNSPKRVASLQQRITVSPDNVAPIWAENITPSLEQKYAQTFPLISGTVSDAFGRIDADGFNLLVNDENFNNSLVKTKEDFGRQYRVTGDINPLEEGVYEISLSAKDFADNLAQPNPITRSMTIDRTPPVIELAQTEDVLTNLSLFSLNYSVQDQIPTLIEVFNSGVLVKSFDASLDGNKLNFSENIALSEGVNTVEVHAVDRASNNAIPQTLVVTLDTIPPQLTHVTPENGSIVSTPNFNFSARSNELLSGVIANGFEVTLNEDMLSFSGSVTSTVQGPFTFEIVATDLAGNSLTQSFTYDIRLEPLFPELITLIPGDDGNLIVRGAAGAAEPGIEISINGGIFNNKTVIANADGSFEAVIRITSSVTVSATSSITNKTKKVGLNFGLNTTLSGVIKDSITGFPLKGVTVSLDGSSSARTTSDGDGIFYLSDIPTGDRVLTIDGSTIPLENAGKNRKFFKTKISVNIGVSQKNVLDSEIYLTPLLSDGSETAITNGSAAVVTSSYAPGVKLSIPQGRTTFPDGTNTGAINMVEVSSQRMAVPPLDFAVPDTVIALEPSGLKFSQPVELTLPNVNEFPPGAQMVIMSKDSIQGIWTIDGVAKVSEDGSEIVTEPGQGITHFSEVYASPLGPKARPLSENDQPSSDTFNGSLSTSINLPSFKSLGNDVSPSLVYKSSWANPTIAITDILDIPRMEVTLPPFNSGYRLPEFSTSVSATSTSWVEPRYIEAQFMTEDFASEKFKFKGIPNKSVVSFGMDLSSVASGPHPYNTHYDIHLNQMIIGTRTVVVSPRFGGRTMVRQSRFEETRAIEEAFPQDSGGLAVTQNYVNSSAGRGWRISGVQKIVNPDSPRIMVEEEGGSIANYTIDSTIETLHDAGSSELRAVDLSTWPNTTYVDQNNFLKKVSLIPSENPILVSQSVDYKVKSGTYTNRHVAVYSPSRIRCLVGNYHITVSRSVQGTLDAGDGRIFNVDTHGGLFMLDGSVDTPLVGTKKELPQFLTPIVCSPLYEQPRLCEGARFCRDRVHSSSNCGFTGLGPIPYLGDADRARVLQYYPNNLIEGVKGTVCDVPNTPDVQYGLQGFKDGSATEALFNSPTNISRGFGNNLLVIDRGNNRVRSVNLTDFSVTTIAGNGQNLDNGDGNAATQASIFHPLAATYDSSGNLYITSERGLIRKVDTDGVITRYAGKTAAEGGVLTDIGLAENMIFSQLNGIAIDNAKNLMYVADTGNNRVVRINMTTKIAQVVAGSGTCSAQVVDGVAALNTSLCMPMDVGLDEDGNLLIADTGHRKIRRVTFGETSSGKLNYLSSAEDNSILERNEDGSFTRTYRNGNIAQFNNKGLHLYSENRLGRRTSFDYDSYDRLTTVTDPVGRQTQFRYSGDLLSSIEDPAGRVTEFEYTDRFLTKVIFPDESTKSFGYDDSGLMTLETDQNGFQTKYEYNEFKRLATVTRADNSTIVVSDSASQTMANNFVGGNVGELKTFGESEVFDGLTDTRGQTTKFIKDTNGFLTTIIDPQGKETTVERNHKGDPLKITRSDGSTVEYTYDLVTIINRRPTYDVLSISDSATGKTRTFKYNVYGSLIEEKHSTGPTITRTFDDQTGLMETMINASGNLMTLAYNDLGLLNRKTLEVEAGKTFVEERVYDSLGNLTEIETSSGLKLNYNYDAAGNALKSIQTRGEEDTLQTAYTYDSFNRIKSVLSPKSELTQYFYDNNGNLKRITDPEGKIEEFDYDNLNRLVSNTNRYGKTAYFEFNSNGNLKKHTDFNGAVEQFEYDSLDRIIKKIAPDDLLTFDYDSRGNLILAQSKYIRIEREFDSAGRMKFEKVKGLGEISNFSEVTLTSTYNGDGSRTSLSDSLGGATTYSYLSDGRLKSITNHKNELFNFAFDGKNRITKISHPVYETNFTYNNSNFVEEINHYMGSTLKSYHHYQRNGLGFISKKSSSGQEHTFSYDQNNFLTQITDSLDRVPASDPATLEFFSYDSLGNRLGDDRGSYSYDQARQRLLEDAHFTYSYDFNGNLTKKVKKSDSSWINYQYASNNLLKKVSFYTSLFSVTPTKVVEFIYDPVGRRVQKKISKGTGLALTKVRRYIYDGEEIHLELNEQNQVLVRHTHSSIRTDDILASDYTSVAVSEGLSAITGSVYYLKDHLGSIETILNDSGETAQDYYYAGFGKIISVKDKNGTDVTNSPIINSTYSYTGREFDKEIGVYYYRARSYDPLTGRFLQSDPHAGKIGRPLTVVNNYSYVLNNPMNMVDPTGEFGFFAGAFTSLAYSAGISAIQASLTPGEFWGKFGNFFAVNAAATLTGMMVHRIQFGSTANYSLGFGGVYSDSSKPKARGFSAGFFQSIPGETIGSELYWHEVGHSINFALLVGGGDPNNFLDLGGRASAFYLAHLPSAVGGNYNPITMVLEGAADLWASPWYKFGIMRNYEGQFGEVFPSSPAPK